jgi:AraC family transcriptional regulator
MGPSWVERVRDYTRTPDHSLESKGGPLAWLVLRLHSEFRLRDDWSRLAIEGLALEIMAELSRAAEVSSRSAPPEWLEQAKEILGARLPQTPSLADLAGSLGVHPVHLAREFRRRFRCTIGEYIRHRRIEFACREISDTEAPLKQVALAAGFYDQSHFSNTFRRQTGMTPAAYRAISRSS